MCSMASPQPLHHRRLPCSAGTQLGMLPPRSHQGRGLHQPPICCRKACGDGSGTRPTVKGVSEVRCPNTSGKRQPVAMLGWRRHGTGRTRRVSPGQLEGDGQVMTLCETDFYPKADF